MAKMILLAARIFISLWTLLITLFAMFSGAGPGSKGFVHNLPNALPEILLVLFAVMAWYKPRISGILLVLAAIVFYWFFHVQLQLLLFVLIILPPLAAGLILLLVRPRETC
ncbi:hypothetical protein JW933_11010 [candidate division FCPU426 bacterium]|nr:hypothetical protein [candidate division FCPU426 bacterium]